MHMVGNEKQTTVVDKNIKKGIREDENSETLHKHPIKRQSANPVQ